MVTTLPEIAIANLNAIVVLVAIDAWWRNFALLSMWVCVKQPNIVVIVVCFLLDPLLLLLLLLMLWLSNRHCNFVQSAFHMQSKLCRLLRIRKI